MSETTEMPRSLGEEFGRVYRRERVDIAARRYEVLGDASLTLPQELPETLSGPSRLLSDALEELKDADCGGDGFIGLALSGGGIRSSTFNLGVLQAIHRVGLFKYIDYLSTVSGGGYIGTYLSTCIKQDEDEIAADIEERRLTGKPVKDVEEKSLQDDAFPFIHSTGVVEPSRFRHLRNYANFLAPGGKAELLEAPMLLLRGMVVNILSLLPWLLGIALVLGMLLKRGESSAHLYQYYGYSELGQWLCGCDNWSLPAYSFSIALGLAILVFFAAFPLVHGVFMKPLRDEKPLARHLRAGMGRLLARLLVVLLITVFIEAQPWVLQQLSNLQIWFGSSAGGFAGLAVLADKYLSRVSDLMAKVGVTLLGILGLAITWLGVLLMTQQIALGNWELSYVVIVLLVVSAYTIRWVDINASSIHKYYRDHLVRAFVAQVSGNDAQSDTGAPPSLSNMQSKRGPYHILNAAINVDRPPEDENFKSGRRSSFFFFSRHYCGGIRTGYISTKIYEKFCPELDVGTAMAISGAAAAPNMGKFTNPMLSFTLALLNVRLNHWMRNPRMIQKRAFLRLRNLGGIIRGVGPLYLFREMLNRLDADEDYVNLSDGGHIENLGIYELMRRRCRLIIAGDGEADPTLSFEGLSEAIRLARIDFGYRVDMEGLDELRAGDQRYATGTIQYGDGRIGKLIYIKSNLGGDYNLQSTLEPEFYRTSADRNDDYLFDNNAYVAHYRNQNPTFPHETTADQFFDEAQFEAYRALGFEVAEATLIAPTN